MKMKPKTNMHIVIDTPIHVLDFGIRCSEFSIAVPPGFKRFSDPLADSVYIIAARSIQRLI